MSEKVTPQEYWKGFPEAPASDTAHWIDKYGFAHMTTLREWSKEELATVIADFYSDVVTVGGKPDGPALPPKAQIQERDETGVPVVDGDGNAIMTNLPEGTNLYTVKAVFHDRTKTGNKDVLKVVTVEKPYDTKYGVSCFHPPEAFNGWKDWGIGIEYKYAAPEGAGHVVIRDPKDGGKYADVIEFQA